MMRRDDQSTLRKIRSYLSPRGFDGRHQARTQERSEGAPPSSPASRTPDAVHISSNEESPYERDPRPLQQLQCPLFSKLPAELRHQIYSFCLSGMYFHVHNTEYWPDSKDPRWGHRVLPFPSGPKDWIHPYKLIPLDGQDPTIRRQLSLPLTCRRMYV